MAETQESLLADILKETEEQNRLIQDAASDTSWDTAIGIATKLLAFTVDQAKVLDSIGLKNSTLNVSFEKLKDEISEQGYRFGTMAEHMQMQLNLHKIGYKTINKELRDGLVWLDKADGQGQDLLKFMESMSESGTTHKTQELIAKHIIEMADHTGQSARAAIESLAQLGSDNKAILRVLGVEGDVSKAILQMTKDQPAVVAGNIGKFMKEVLDPKNMAQQIHQKIYGPLTKVLMSNSTSVREKQEAILKMIENSSTASTKALLMGNRDTYVIKQYKDIFAGTTGMLGIKLGGSLDNLRAAIDDGTTDGMKQSSAKSYYDGSLTKMSDTAANTAQLTPMRWMLHGLTKFILGDKFVDPSMGTAAQRASIDVSNFDSDNETWREGQKSMLNYLSMYPWQAWAYHSALDKFKKETQPLTEGNIDTDTQKRAIEQMRLRAAGKPYDMWRDSGWVSSKDHKRDPWEDPFPSVNRKPPAEKIGRWSGLGLSEDFSSNPFMNAKGEPITVQLQQKQVNTLTPIVTPVPVVLPASPF